MATPKLDYDKAARALVDDAILGGVEAAKKHGVAVETICRWKKRAETDEKLSKAVNLKLERLRRKDDDSWAKEIPETVRAFLLKMRELLQGDLTMSEVVAGLHEVGDLDFTLRTLEARLGVDRPGNEAGGHSDSSNVEDFPTTGTG